MLNKKHNLIRKKLDKMEGFGEFTKKIGAEFNWRGWGLRSMRYTMLLENEEIKKLVVEEGKCELTAADSFLREI